jgi:hypothetical protein
MKSSSLLDASIAALFSHLQQHVPAIATRSKHGPVEGGGAKKANFDFQSHIRPPQPGFDDIQAFLVHNLTGDERSGEIPTMLLSGSNRDLPSELGTLSTNNYLGQKQPGSPYQQRNLRKWPIGQCRSRSQERSLALEIWNKGPFFQQPQQLQLRERWPPNKRLPSLRSQMQMMLEFRKLTDFITRPLTSGRRTGRRMRSSRSIVSNILVSKEKGAMGERNGRL